MPPKLTPGAPTPKPYDIQGAIDNFRNMLLTDRANPKENEVPVETVPRPGYNTTGKEVELLVNCFPITNFPTKAIYQYEVSVIHSNIALMLDIIGGTLIRGSTTMMGAISL